MIGFLNLIITFIGIVTPGLVESFGYHWGILTTFPQYNTGLTEVPKVTKFIYAIID